MKTELFPSIEQSKNDLDDPRYLHEQARLPKEAWDERFRIYIDNLSEQNQREMKEVDEYMKKRKEGTLTEEEKRDAEETPEMIYERYLESFDLDEEDLRDKRILDLGSGGGEFVQTLLEKGITVEVYGLDINPDEEKIREEFKDHLLKGSFEDELPVDDVDYVLSFGSVSSGILLDKQQFDVKKVIKNAVGALKDDGEIRLFPFLESTETTPLEGIKESEQVWKSLLAEVSDSLNIDYEIVPRAMGVSGYYNDIVLQSEIVIRKRPLSTNQASAGSAPREP